MRTSQERFPVFSLSLWILSCLALVPATWAQLPPPEAPEVTLQGALDLQLVWGAVSGAQVYGLWRAAEADAPFRQIYCAPATEYRDLADQSTNCHLAYNHTYLYKVRAGDASANCEAPGSGLGWSDFSPPATATTRGPEPPAAPEVGFRDVTRVDLTWNRTCAKLYALFRAQAGSGDFRQIHCSSDASYRDEGDHLTPNTVYEYRIRAGDDAALCTGWENPSPHWSPLSEAADALTETRVITFVFSPVSDQVAGVPFHLTLTAVDSQGNPVSDFNDEVRLSTGAVPAVDPSEVAMESGTWEGTVTIARPDYKTHLVASSGIWSGTSDFLTVTQPAAEAGWIFGQVTRPAGAPLSAPVRLYDRDANLLRETESNPNGDYWFLELQPGSYGVGVESDNFRSARVWLSISPGLPTGANLRVYENPCSERPPVILVPGMMGSTLRDSGGLYPALPRDLEDPEDLLNLFATQLRVHNPFDSTGFDDLTENLRDLNFDVILEAPWDWRLPVNYFDVDTDTSHAIAWRRYLKPVIDQAKAICGASKVHVVTHSMGGLVARGYIQSADYDRDVDRLAMVGTPNYGSLTTYYIVEGADPYRADDLSDPPLLPGLDFYSNTSNNLYETIEGRALFHQYPVCEAGGGSPRCRTATDFQRLNGLTRFQLREFYREHVPSARQLLPAFADSLIREGEAFAMRNLSLEALNGDSRLILTCANCLPGQDERVRTELFLGTGEGTVLQIPVGEPQHEDGIYPLGRPAGEPEITEQGDGSVLSDLPEVETYFAHITRFRAARGRHSGLTGAFREEIANFLIGLGGARPSNTDERPDRGTENVEMKTELPRLELTVLGIPRPLLVDPAGYRTGVVPGEGEVVRSIPSSSLATSPPASTIGIDNPLDGLYAVHLFSPGDEGEVVTVTLTHVDAGGRIEEMSFRELYHGGVLISEFKVDTDSASPLQLIPRVLPPNDVHSFAENDATRIVWFPPAISPAGYNIYGRRLNGLFYQLLASTPDTEVLVDVPFQGSDTWQFFVLSRDASGEESFITQIVENRQRLAARFNASPRSGPPPLSVSFSSAVEGPFTVLKWDLDGDDVVDSYDPHPIFTYTEEGRYSVTLQVEGPYGTTYAFEQDFIVVDSTSHVFEVGIDVKPGSGINPINPSSRGKTPVAILSSPTFDAPAEVDRFSLSFGSTGDEASLHIRGNGEPNCGEQDFNADGHLDLACHFLTRVAGFEVGDGRGIVRGSTIAGEPFEGYDSIRIVGGGYDGDADGLEDEAEDMGPNNGDGNADGWLDSTQMSVTSLRSAVTGDFVTVVTEPPCINTEVRALDAASLPADPGFVLPQGAVGFRLVAPAAEVCASSLVTLFFHGESSLAGAVYRKLLGERWRSLPATFAQQMVGSEPVATAEIFLVDGGQGDGDGLINGVITDPGGPALRGVAQIEIPTLSAVGLVAIAAALGVLGLVTLRRRSA